MDLSNERTKPDCTVADGLRRLLSVYLRSGRTALPSEAIRDWLMRRDGRDGLTSSVARLEEAKLCHLLSLYMKNRGPGDVADGRPLDTRQGLQTLLDSAWRSGRTTVAG